MEPPNLDPSTGEFTYRSDEGFSGLDSFTIRVQDQAGQYKDCVVTINVEKPKTVLFFADPAAAGKGGMGWLLFGLAFIFLIILFFYNVKITYLTKKPDGSQKKVVRRYCVVSGKKDEVILELKREKNVDGLARDTEVVLLRSFVLRFRGKTLKIMRDGMLVKMVKVEANRNGKMIIPL
jgi:hypothetical protein